MKNNYLKNEILKLQNAYCKLLKNSLIILETNNFSQVLDEINLFWFSNRKKVEFLLKYYYADSNTFVHTGASFIDIDKFEHFPFVLLGDKHIIDDPAGNFCDNILQIQRNKAFAEFLQNQVILTIQQNIKIIENYNDIIQIFPLRLLNKEDRVISFETAQKAFFSLFIDRDMSVEKYNKNIISIEDVSNAIPLERHSDIHFGDMEIKGSLIERFKDFISKHNFFTQETQNEAQQFKALIIGYFIQAVDIIFICLKYKVSPFIRYSVPFHYITLLLISIENILNQNEYENIYKMVIASYKTFKDFDREQFKDTDFIHFFEDLQSKPLKAYIMKKIQAVYVSPNSSIKPILDIIDEYIAEVQKLKVI